MWNDVRYFFVLFFSSSLFKYFTAVILQITVNVQSSRIQKLNNLCQTNVK